MISYLTEDDQPPEEAPPPPPAAPLPEESDDDEKDAKEASDSKIEAVKPEPEVVPEVEAGGVKIVVTQATKEDLFEETEKPTIVEIKDDIAKEETPKEEIVAPVTEEAVAEPEVAVVEPEVAQDVSAVEAADDKKSVKSSGDEESIKHVDDDKVEAVVPAALIDDSIITTKVNNEAEIAVIDQVDATVEPVRSYFMFGLKLQRDPKLIRPFGNSTMPEHQVRQI